MTLKLHPGLFWLVQIVANLAIFYLAFLPGFPAWLMAGMVLFWWLVVTEIGPKGALHPIGWWVIYGWSEYN